MNIPGCDFICKNHQCSRYEQKITLFSKWPLVDIDFLLDMKLSPDLLKKVKNDKDFGRQCALMIYPADIEHEIVGYCFNGWCPSEKKVYFYDVLMREYSYDYKIPALSQYNNEIYSFDYCLDNGILCPFCGDKMFLNRWFCSTLKN